jgi:7-cyano-7-deazaguanine synthase
MSAPLTAVILSGGMDSTALMAHYHANGDRLLAVSIDYGQRHRREIMSAADVAAHYNAQHIVVDLSPVGRLLTGSALTDASIEVPIGHYAAPSMKATVVPNRNMIFTSVVVGVAISRGASTVALGVHAGDHAIYPDCRPEFIDAVARAVEVGNEGFDPPAVEAPFVHITKTDIVRHATELGAPLDLTWSCYKGGAVHCGTCGTCVERQEAFRDAGVADPTRYETAA